MGPCAIWSASSFIAIRLALTSCALLGSQVAIAQDDPTQQKASPSTQDDSEMLRQQIAALSNPSYRARQLARWRLEQAPLQSIVEIEGSIRSVDHNAAAQLIDLLSSMAMSSDVEVSMRSQTVLRGLADNASSVGRLSSNTLNAIADLQEERAIEILTFHGAEIGPGLFAINGQALPDANLLGLKIDESFDGGPNAIQWIRFLKSIDAVYFSGEQIDTRYYEAISGLSRLRAIKLKRVSLTEQDLKLFRNLVALEHLGINYVPIGDEFVPAILELPVSHSLRLYGTRVTEIGEQRLNMQLDGIQIYRGNGGFLGVATSINSTLVTQVSRGSAADAAGIEEGDHITHVDDVPIANFDDLRTELGKHVAGDEVVLRIERRKLELQLIAILGEDQS